MSDETKPAPESTPAAADAEPTTARPAPTPSEPPAAQRILREIMSSSPIMIVGALLIALVLGGVLIAFSNPEVQRTASYLFARPGDFFSAVWHSVSSAYVALFEGAIFDVQAKTFERGIRSITETMTVSTPLIFAGLGLGIGFRAGMFNIGAQGQIILGAIFGGYIGFAWHLPAVLHVLIAVLGAFLGGAIWAGIAGVLKATTGANEVIVTIMLNNVALYLVAYLLSLNGFKAAGSANPISPPITADATLPSLLGPAFRLNAGFLLAIVAAIAVWWLMDRSTIGFKWRAVGANPSAAATAGISVRQAYIWVMVTAGALAGLAGAAQVLGTDKVLTDGVAASFGFDAITVALLGRSRPLGTVFAGLLFGGLRAGGVLMQTRTDTPIDIVLVVQSIIVLLIAAPPLVRAIFRLPKPRARRVKAEVAS